MAIASRIPPRITSRDPSRGVTLIELIVVMAVMATLVTLALPMVAGSSGRRALEAVATELATDLRYVRSEAVARNVGIRVGFESSPGRSCYVIHTGPAGGCSCLQGTPAVCSGDAREIKTVQIPPDRPVQMQSKVPSMLFDPRRGTTSPAGSITLVGPNGVSITHVVNLMGRVRSCALVESAAGKPPGTLPGYRAC